jgi:hypothetical protein
MAMLVSLADMKTYLGETTTDFDDFLTQQITVVSDAIEGYTARVFASTSYVQTFFYKDYSVDFANRYLYTFHYPVTTITQIQEIKKDADGNDITPVTTLTAPEFRIKGDTGKLYKTYKAGEPRNWFECRDYSERIEVTYTAGFATTPTPVEQCVYDLVEQQYNKKKSGIAVNFGKGVQRISIPGVMSLDFDYTLTSNERKSKFGMILGDYGNVLDQYASERSLGGFGEIRENYVS